MNISISKYRMERLRTQNPSIKRPFSHTRGLWTENRIEHVAYLSVWLNKNQLIVSVRFDWMIIISLVSTWCIVIVLNGSSTPEICKIRTIVRHIFLEDDMGWFTNGLLTNNSLNWMVENRLTVALVDFDNILEHLVDPTPSPIYLAKGKHLRIFIAHFE